jgi:hypothetical protein
LANLGNKGIATSEQQIQELAEDIQFWKDQSSSLAIFAAPSYMRGTSRCLLPGISHLANVYGEWVWLEEAGSYRLLNCRFGIFNTLATIIVSRSPIAGASQKEVMAFAI